MGLDEERDAKKKRAMPEGKKSFHEFLIVTAWDDVMNLHGTLLVFVHNRIILEKLEMSVLPDVFYRTLFLQGAWWICELPFYFFSYFITKEQTLKSTVNQNLVIRAKVTIF